MTHPDNDRLEALFLDVIEQPEDEREQYIEEHCGQDTALLERITALLVAHRSADMVLVDPTRRIDMELERHGAPAATDPVAALETGQRICRAIGGYELVRLLGEGGMGLVFLVRQERPRREVALKIIRPDHADQSTLGRFEHEAAVLGRLQHPGIAQIFEAGVVQDEGRAQPYFVMEYVRGAPIIEYADARKMGTPERLELLALICQALQHAHGRGVIHRDLKPGNILVTEDGQPKVLDFGVARVTDSDVRATVRTALGQLIGTVPYMSPEQAAGDPRDIDTRSDVYALGVLGYELLTGQLPHDLSKVLVHEAVRVIREEEPTRLGAIDRIFRGDVETIIGKALEKERARRYQTASELASDIERYLTDEPIQARPPSAIYQLRKLARRHRGLAASLIVTLVLTLGGLVVANVLQTRMNKRLATAVSIAEAVNAFLNEDLLAAVAPSLEPGKGKDVLMREVLDEAAMRIEEASGVGGRFEQLPLVEASIRHTLGNTYFLLGEYDAAELHLERARLLRRRTLGEEHLSTLNVKNSLTTLFARQGRYGEAETLSIELSEIMSRVHGEGHPRALSVMNKLAGAYKNQGRYDKAEALYDKTLGLLRSELGEEHRDTLGSMNDLAGLYKSQGRYREAEALYVETLGLMRSELGDYDRCTLNCIDNLAMLYVAQFRYRELELLFVESLESRNRIQGEGHPLTMRARRNLAVLYTRQGLWDDAEPLLVETLEITKRRRGPEHLDTLEAMQDLAAVYEGQGRYDEQGRYDDAEALCVKTLELMKRIKGEEHADTLASMDTLATLYGNQGKMDDARPLVRTLLEVRRRRADQSGSSAGSKNQLAWNLLTCKPADMRDPETALRLARDACAMTNHAHPESLDTFALAQHLTGDTPAAVETARKALSLLHPDDPRRGQYEAALARFESALAEEAAEAAENPGGG